MQQTVSGGRHPVRQMTGNGARDEVVVGSLHRFSEETAKIVPKPWSIVRVFPRIRASV